MNLIKLCGYSLLLVVVLLGCATSFSTLQHENPNQKAIYLISEEQAFDIALSSFNRVLPGMAVTDVDGPPRGYSATQRRIIDSYFHNVSVIPALAKDAELKGIQGYYFEVSGSGTLEYGPATNRELFSTVLSAAQATGKSVYVSDVLIGTYKWAGWKNEQGDNQRRYAIGENIGNNNDVFNQIEQLKVLRDKDAITDEEYQNKKKELLDRIK
jgi:hypothetical protein